MVEQPYAFCHALYGIKGFMEFVECSFSDGYFSLCLVYSWASQVVLKNPPANAEDIRDTGSIPGFRRSSGGGHDNPLQYSSLENPMQRGAWQATVYRAAKSQT